MPSESNDKNDRLCDVHDNENRNLSDSVQV